MTQSGWKLTLEIITNYRQKKKNAKIVFTVRETKMCVASSSAIHKTIAEEFSLLFFFPSNYRH